MSSPLCERVRPMLAELATTAATGHDRAQILWHVVGCPTCQHELAELARVADDLLLLAPEREPPPGFETRVVQRVASLAALPAPGRAPAPRLRAALRSALTRVSGPFAGTRRRSTVRTARRVFAGATALVLAAVLGAGVQHWRSAEDRRLADEYRHGVAVGGDRYPRTASVNTEGGVVVGRVYLFSGTPSWILVTLTAAPQPGGYTMSVVTTGGIRYAAGVCQVSGQVGTSGYPLPVPMNQIALIEMTRPGIHLDARL